MKTGGDRHFDVVALGEGMLEFNQTDAGKPNYLQGFGGDTSNAVIAAARADAKTAYLSRVGNDTFGQSLRELWQREGVDSRAVETDDDSPTGIYFVTHGPEGHEFSYCREGSAASRMTARWLLGGPASRVIRTAKILHVSGISLAISTSARETSLAAMKLAREAGTRVSFDPNLRLKLWSLDDAREGITAAMALCDIFLPSLEDVTTLTGMTDVDAVIDWGHAAGASVVVLKLGAEGAVASNGRRRERLASHAVQTVDATGAGDCFCGNLLARLSAGDSIFAAARYANAAAAIAVQGFGAVAPLPRPEQVRAPCCEAADRPGLGDLVPARGDGRCAGTGGGGTLAAARHSCGGTQRVPGRVRGSMRRLAARGRWNCAAQRNGGKPPGLGRGTLLPLPRRLRRHRGAPGLGGTRAHCDRARPRLRDARRARRAARRGNPGVRRNAIVGNGRRPVRAARHAQ
jgi:2-dehydro-3-deoxygluconokinase